MNATPAEMQRTHEHPYFVMELPEGHPVRTYFDENVHIRGILAEIEATDASADPQKAFNLFNQLSEIEKRYARKENQLFPFLEKRGWDGPSRGMWSFHDAIRDLMRGVRKKFEVRTTEGLNEDLRAIREEMYRLMSVEESRLFPISLKMLSTDDWEEMKAGEEEIGWMIKIHRAVEPHASSGASTPKKKELPFPIHDRLRLDEGYLSPEQVNLLLKVIPVDLTYVDENDRVVFYNRGEDRVFPRSAGVIGREVRFCHPPKSVDTVLKILEAFRDGTKNEAEFWIKFKGRVVHIRYFAVRDHAKVYRGVIEMTQDITDIQKLEGEKRLLNWDEA